MAEPVRKDEPLSRMRFPETSGSGPVPVATADASVQLPEHATDTPLGEWPASAEIPVRSTAETGTIETAVWKAKKITANVQDRVEDLRGRVRVIRGRVQSGELQEQLKERASDLAENASRRARIIRNRADSYARNSPLAFIAGAAAAGFAIGILLRMWRDE